MIADPARIQPMPVTQVFVTANALYRQNGKLFLGIVAPPILVKVILDWLFPAGKSSLSSVVGLIDLVLITLAVGAVIVAIAARYQGRPITVADAYRTLGLRGAAVLFLATLLSFIFIGAGLLLLLIPGLFLTVKFAFVAQSVALERQGIWGALRRSWRLTDGHFRRVVGLSLLNLLFQIVVTLILLPVILLILHFTGAVGAFLLSLLQIVGIPFFEGLLTVLYFDILARQATTEPAPTSLSGAVR